MVVWIEKVDVISGGERLMKRVGRVPTISGRVPIYAQYG
jgi:hypothetical protein